MVLYNLSRGDDDLRLEQIDEVLADPERYRAITTTYVLAAFSSEVFCEQRISKRAPIDTHVQCSAASCGTAT